MSTGMMSAGRESEAGVPAGECGSQGDRDAAGGEIMTAPRGSDTTDMTGYLQAHVFLNGGALELTDAAAEAFAARVPARAPTTRQSSDASKQKLLARLQADPELVTAEGYKQFGYSGPSKLVGNERLIEREYWLKFNKAVGPDLAGAHGWVLAHMHFAGSLRSGDDSEITQINVPSFAHW
jgi:hypothetical protein